MPDWWVGFPNERFWCEVADGPSVGTRLACPRADLFGRPWWSFDFIRLVRPGDVVFHFSPSRRRVVGASVAGEPCTETVISWPAPPRGILDTTDRGLVSVPGWTRPLHGFREIGAPLTLDMIRADLQREWHSNWWEMSQLPGYLPFHTMVFPRRAPSALGYLLKIPADLVGYWPPLADLAAALDRGAEVTR